MLLFGILSLHLFFHVVYLQGEYRQPVNCPCGTLSVESCIRQRFHLTVLLSEIRVNLLHKVGPVLIAAVDASFQLQSLGWINVGVPYDILEMPLDCVYPALHIEVIVDGASVIRIVHWRIDIVGEVIVSYRLSENYVAVFCK